jgi:hypothetical protein
MCHFLPSAQTSDRSFGTGRQSRPDRTKGALVHVAGFSIASRNACETEVKRFRSASATLLDMHQALRSHARPKRSGKPCQSPAAGPMVTGRDHRSLTQSPEAQAGWFLKN